MNQPITRRRRRGRGGSDAARLAEELREDDQRATPTIDAPTVPVRLSDEQVRQLGSEIESHVKSLAGYLLYPLDRASEIQRDLERERILGRLRDCVRTLKHVGLAPPAWGHRDEDEARAIERVRKLEKSLADRSKP